MQQNYQVSRHYLIVCIQLWYVGPMQRDKARPAGSAYGTNSLLKAPDVTVIG